ncbi:MAG: response regulator [Verrucomicrobiae bacterium]|nr:response regulator [Verrucomicrobiae bacterium]
MTGPIFPKNSRILVIDDNQAIHADFKKILQRSDASSVGLDAAGAELFGETSPPVVSISFELDSAHSGEDGLALVQAALAKGCPYALAFVDVRMAPGWNGIETTAHICKSDPDIQIVICTAYSDYSWEEMIQKLGQSDRLVILKKPFDTVEVLQLAHALTDKWALGQQARARMDLLEQMVAVRTRELQAANEQLKIEMSERALAEDALRQAQKMEAIGQLAGGIAHDFNNLLTVIRGYVQCLILELPPAPSVSEALREIDVAAERAAKLTSQMLMFSRKKRIQSQSLDLNEVIAQFGNMLRRLLGENIALEIQTAAAPLTIHADPVMIEMVVLNLAVNARDAMPQGGRLVIRTEAVEIKPGNPQPNPKAQPGSFACIRVTDTGCGIPPEVLPHLFEPFFTTKEVGKGTGLGLATVYGIVKQHSGWVEIESEPGRGATFKVYLPINLKKSEPGTSFKSKPRALGGTETILLVEDEQALRRLARTILQRHGYRIYEASSGTEGLALWSKHAAEINLLVTDMIMPGGMSGRQLADNLLRDRNDLKVIYTTGYSPDTISQNLVLEEGVNFLPKPYHSEKLIQIIRRRLDEPANKPHEELLK